MGAVCFIDLDFLNQKKASQNHKNLVIAHELGHAVYLKHPVVPEDQTGDGGHGNDPDHRKNCIMNAAVILNEAAPTTFCDAPTATDNYVCKEQHKVKLF